MKVTRKQYEKALTDLPKIRKVEQIIKVWTEGVKTFGAAAETNEILSISDDGKVESQPKEVPRVAGEPGRKTA